MDTLNRHMLTVYNSKAKAKTPNIERLASQSVIFDNHFIGSAPCMPARRDILTGRLSFLERNWGPIEPFDITLPRLLRENSIFTHMITDHSHYVELGGEGYLQQFNTWDFIRGQETDVWVSKVKQPDNIPEDYLGRIGLQYQYNRQHYIQDADYPTPRTFSSAIQWLKENEGADDFYLMIDAFDPHEPFDASEEFKGMYPDTFNSFYDWPRYDFLNADETPEAIGHLRNQYYATLTMADKWLGKFLDEIDKQNLFDDTMIIFTSDHGHMLGEHNVTGKNLFHGWNEMCHIPLFVHLPENRLAGTHISALTQNIDLFPTILDYFSIHLPDKLPPLHGRSLLKLLTGKADKIRDYAIYGWFGMPVNITDGHYTYFRAPQNQDNKPLYMYGSMLTTFPAYMGNHLPDELISCGRYLSWVDMPVYRVEMSESMKYIKKNEELFESRLYDLKADYNQLKQIENEELEQTMCQALCRCLMECQAPQEQFSRLGLKESEYHLE